MPIHTAGTANTCGRACGLTGRIRFKGINTSLQTLLCLSEILRHEVHIDNYSTESKSMSNFTSNLFPNSCSATSVKSIA